MVQRASPDHPLVQALARAGFIAAEDEAAELLAAAHGDETRLHAMLQRRLTGEPLAWITGHARFCGIDVTVDPGVYVPRWHSEQLALRAAARLPENGVAVDVCTGSGAVAAVLSARRPRARVVGSDLDERAVTCARRNRVEAYRGDLFDPLPAELRGRVDVVTGVVPYVPTAELPLLQRDTFSFETPLAYDGGDDGTAVLRRVLAEAPAWLRPGGAVVLELGGRQPALLAEELARLGYAPATVLVDEEGDVRGIEAVHEVRLASDA
jgi:release factor glutamine methyltransferase